MKLSKPMFHDSNSALTGTLALIGAMTVIICVGFGLMVALQGLFNG